MCCSLSAAVHQHNAARALSLCRRPGLPRVVSERVRFEDRGEDSNRTVLRVGQREEGATTANVKTVESLLCEVRTEVIK